MRYKNLDTKYSGYYSLLSVIIFFADRVRKPILVEALLKAGVDTEIADSCKMRAVHWAARIGEDRIIDLYGAEISMRKINMEIPLCIGLCEPL
ncbi:hypothetical protein [Wolbachia pipientis]|nr:hypothetical protein [Wolbachia pipientis]